MKFSENITVSVCMITYNHEKYIKEAINDVLMQNCNFQIELIIANDCSPGNTDFIVNEIIKNHPKGNLINYTKHENNLGMIPNFHWALDKCQGKYIAMCEGDDYWTDPDKLQKQVEFLEANPDFVLCGHNVKVWSENKNKFIKDPIYSFRDKTIDIEKLAIGNMIHTPSVVFRKIDFTEFVEYFKDSPAGDYPLYMYLSQFGKIKKLRAKMAVYRVHGSSVWSSLNNINRLSKWLEVLNLLVLYFQEKKKLKVVKMLENQELLSIRTIFVARRIDKLLINDCDIIIRHLIIKYPRVFENYLKIIEGKITIKIETIMLFMLQRLRYLI